jgi:hypothetical protein
MLGGKERSQAPAFDKADFRIQVEGSVVMWKGCTYHPVRDVVAEHDFYNAAEAYDVDEGNELDCKIVDPDMTCVQIGSVNVSQTVYGVANAVIHVFGGDSRVVNGRKKVADNIE